MAQPSALLSIIERACDELGLQRPSVVVASTDEQIRQLLAHLQSEGRYLSSCFDWSVLRTLYTFPTVNGTATYAVPSDFDRYIPDTFWNRTTDLRLNGPDLPQIDRWRQESTAGQAGIRQNFRLIGSNIQIFPTPTAADTIVYEYISTKWARSSGAVAQTEFLADTDTSVFDVYLMIKGLKWRWLSMKGLGEAQIALNEYQDYLEKMKGKDNAGETLLMGEEPGMPFISLGNIPDTGFAT